jgi:histidinol phosphatase-like PHP family hydrolase
MWMDTDLDRLPPEVFIEINNRYVWRNDWRVRLAPYTDRFRFVINSDAHQPHWLSQTVARRVAAELGVEETLLFPQKMAVSSS